jgi:hypothetical protein
VELPSQAPTEWAEVVSRQWCSGPQTRDPPGWIKLWGVNTPEQKLRAERGRMLLVAGVVVTLLLIAAIRWRSRRRHALSRTPEWRERRRSYRVALATPVFVYGWLADEPFSENTETLNVSANGGLIPLSGTVVLSQELILTNLQTNEDLSCRVARSTRTEDGKIVVGLEFLQALPNFWQIDFVSNLPRPNFPTEGSHSSNLVLNSLWPVEPRLLQRSQPYPSRLQASLRPWSVLRSSSTSWIA